MNSTSWFLSFNGKAIDFSKGICETDEEGKKDCMWFINVRYLLTVPISNNLITWSGKSFFLELVIFGCYKKGLFRKLHFGFNGKVFSAVLK
jgi:hypothetical protein